MKRYLITLGLLTACASVLAQGTVIFNNRVTGTLVTHVYWGGNQQLSGNGPDDYPPGNRDWTGFTPLSGSGFMAQLLAADLNSEFPSLQPARTPATTFRTGAAAGFVAPLTATLWVVPDATLAMIQMVAWDNRSGLYVTWESALVAWRQGLIAAGESPTFNLSAIGGIPNPAPNLIGLQSFNIYLIPEPAKMALASLGFAIILVRFRGFP